MSGKDDISEGEYLESLDMLTQDLDDGSFVLFPNASREEAWNALKDVIGDQHVSEHNRRNAQAEAIAREKRGNLYVLAKSAKKGETCTCPGCGKSFEKKSYQQAFCSNKGRNNCKDTYWNRATVERTNRAKSRLDID